MAGRRRTAARARVSGGWPTDPVTCPDGRVSLRPLQGLESLGGQFLLVRPLTRFCAQRPGRFRRGEERPRCRPGAGTAQAFSTHPKVEEAEGSGSALGGPWLPRHPPPWITEGPPCVRRRGAGASLHQKTLGKKGGIFFLKPKIEISKVLPNGVFIPHV